MLSSIVKTPSRIAFKSQEVRGREGPARPRRHVVVVGNGMASHRLCEKLAASSSFDKFKLTVLGEEPLPAYDRVHLTEFLGHRDPQKLLLAPLGWYEERGIDLRLKASVDSIDAAARRVTLQSGETLAYDSLVLATGSYAVRPPIDGLTGPDIYLYRNLRDVQALCDHLPRQGKAAVLGGGLLGLEAARALQALGLSVTVLEGTRHLLSRQINAAAADRVRRRLLHLGIEVREKSVLERVEQRTPSGLRLHFSEDLPLACDVLVVATGVRPRDELAKTCDLNVSARGGFVVDARLRTSKPGIYAIGECAAYEGEPYGLAAPGYRMAETLAAVLEGKRRRFTGADTSTTLKVMGLDVQILGEPLSEGVEHVQESDEAYRLVVTRRGRILGGLSVGPWDEGERVRQAILARKFVAPWRLTRFVAGGRLWKEKQADDPLAWSASTQLCHCNGVSKGKVMDAIAQGCGDVASIKAATRASAVCGGCEPALRRLLDPTAALPAAGPGLLWPSLAALALVLAVVFGPAWPVADSVLDARHAIEILWRDSFWHQVTGYSLLGIFVLGLLLPLRKRVPRLSNWGGLARWRWLHALTGALTLIGFLVHTGGTLGHGWNFALAVAFAGLNGLGAVAGWSLARAEKSGEAWAARVRKTATWAHILLFWPLPLLIGFHVWSVLAY